MKSLAIALVFLLSACSTTVPVTAKFPQAPGTLVQEPCPNLQKLQDEAKLSDVAKTVTVNYSEQKVIYEGLK